MSPADGVVLEVCRTHSAASGCRGPALVAIGRGGVVLLAAGLWTVGMIPSRIGADTPPPPGNTKPAPPPQKPPEPSSPPHPIGELLTPAALRDKLKGRATYDPKSGELTLTYDFATADQLQDFTPEVGKPKLVGRALVLEPGVKVVHVVQFKTLNLTAVLGAPPRKGVFLAGTSLTASIGGSTAHTLYLEVVGEKKISAALPKDQPKGPTKIACITGDGLVTVTFGAQKLGKSAANPKVGRVSFHGGEQGYTFGNIVIGGKVDPQWANDFFAPKRPGTVPLHHP